MTGRVKSFLAGAALGLVLAFRSEHPQADCPACWLMRGAGRLQARLTKPKTVDELAQRRANGVGDRIARVVIS